MRAWCSQCARTGHTPSTAPRPPRRKSRPEPRARSLCSLDTLCTALLIPRIRSIVARIPKTLCLSHRTSSLARHLEAVDLDDELLQSPPVRLALHVAHELGLGDRSPWHVYFQHAPQESVPVAALWDETDDRDALRWLRGTQAHRQLARSSFNKVRSVRHENFGRFARLTPRTLDQRSLCDLFSRLPPLPHAVSLSTFLHACSLVSSRAFHIDAFHTLALVPLADVFNHSDEPHVHLESDLWVCPLCGALEQCPHDEDEEGDRVDGQAEKKPASGDIPPAAASASRGRNSVHAAAADDTCDMVTERAILPGEEIFNTYGDLSNARLLAAYGFVLEANEADRVEFDEAVVREVVQACVPCSRTAPRPGWPSEYERTDFAPEEEHPLVTWRAGDGPGRPHLFLDADARISIDLFRLVLELTDLDRSGPANQDADGDAPGRECRPVLGALAELYAAAVVREDESLDNEIARDDAAGPHPTAPASADSLSEMSAAHLHAQRLASVVANLCDRALSAQERPELTVEELLDRADSESEQVSRVRPRAGARFRTPLNHETARKFAHDSVTDDRNHLLSALQAPETKERLALRYLAGERALLQQARSHWQLG